MAARFAREELHAATAFVVHDRTTYGEGGAEAFRTAAGLIGLTLVGYEGFSGAQNTQAPEFHAILRRIVATTPDVVYFGGNYIPAAGFFRQARDKGVRAAFLGPDALDAADLAKVTGQAVVGLHYVTSAWSIEAYPDAHDFAREFQRRFGTQPRPLVAEAYDAAWVGLRAIELAFHRAGGRRPTRREVSEAIRSLPDMPGLTGTISFDDRGDRRLARYFVVRVDSPYPERWEYNRVVKIIEAPPSVVRR